MRIRINIINNNAKIKKTIHKPLVLISEKPKNKFTHSVVHLSKWHFYLNKFYYYDNV